LGQLCGWTSAYDGWDESDADQLSGRCFGGIKQVTSKIEKIGGGVRRRFDVSKWCWPLLGLGCGATKGLESSGGEASNKGRIVSSVALNKLSFKFNLKL
jgi:hypothetical protein